MPEQETITQQELTDIVLKHDMFMTGKPGGRRALLRDIDISGLSLMGKNLSQSDFTGCTFAGTNLSAADFSGATLFGCNFSQAILFETKMIKADFLNTL